MDYELIAYKELKKNLKQIMSLSFYSCKDKEEAVKINHLAHECEKMINKLESHCKRPK